MAATKKSAAQRAAKEAAKIQFATADEVKAIGSAVSELADIVRGLAEKVSAPAVPAQPETPLDKEIRKAAPDDDVIPRAWQEKAEEYLGDSLDHVEVKHLKGGGMVFTLVIKPEKSNAKADYMERTGSDRRSKEVGSEGIAGVEEWCKLVKANLARPR